MIISELLSEAKKFKVRYNYAYTQAKNQAIYLQQTEDSHPIRVKDLFYEDACQSLAT